MKNLILLIVMVYIVLTVFSSHDILDSSTGIVKAKPCVPHKYLVCKSEEIE